MQLRFVEGDSSLSSDHINISIEDHVMKLDPEIEKVPFSMLVGKLSSSTQMKMEGKIISYYHRGCQSFVFLGCTPENKERIKDRKAFDPDSIPGCVNAYTAGKDLSIHNLIPSQLDMLKMNIDMSNALNVPNMMIFKVRARAKNDQIKSLVQGQDQSTSKGSRRTKERKIGEVIQKVQKWR
jgi:hypothetical protein